MLFTSYSGRKFDDSPKAIYEEVCNRKEFNDWDLIWLFIEPNNFEIKRGRKIKIDTLSYLKALLTSKVWVSNSGITRGINFNNSKIIKVETWHGSVLKKGCGEENQNLIKTMNNNSLLDNETIRCSQSPLDTIILGRLFNADQKSFLNCGFPRNDELVNANELDVIEAKKRLKLPLDKKIILYAPTWREYTFDDNLNVYCRPPINLEFWEKELGSDYIVLFRAHYAVVRSLIINNNDFVRTVSDYPYINDLYLASDLMISDYSSAIIDFSILEKPILCFAYDFDEYKLRRGLYWDLENGMPYGIQTNEKDIIDTIKKIDFYESKMRMRKFKEKHAPFAKGYASKTVVNEILDKLKMS